MRNGKRDQDQSQARNNQYDAHDVQLPECHLGQLAGSKQPYRTSIRIKGTILLRSSVYNEQWHEQSKRTN